MNQRLAKLFTIAGLGLVLGVGAFGIRPSITLAADVATDTLTSVGGETGLSTTDPKIIIGNIIRTGLGVIGIILVCFIVYGGFVWMTAAGRPDQVDKAKKILINAVIGLIIILMSWSIATFVISSLTNATGTGGPGGTGGGGGPGPGLGGGSPSSFTATGYSPFGSVTIRNIVPRITFSKTVDSTTVDANITITDASGTAVAGTYVTTGNYVKFTPAAACPDPNSDRFCFDENAVFTITVGTGLLSSSGAAITCNTTTPCRSTFTSGSLVDTEDPVVSIVVPESNEGVPTDSTMTVEGYFTDDAGIAGADFLIDDEWQDSLPPIGNPTETTIDAELSTVSFIAGDRYTVSVTATDLAGNTNTDSVSVRAQPEWCFNGVLDADLGETGIDCGGDATATTYCGACDGSSCTESADCASGSCAAGVCESNPIITDVSPRDGVVGTYVTITGTDFGANTGSILFTDAAGTGTVEAEILTSCADGWSDMQVVVAVPTGAGDGPITLTNADNISDTTDDDSGELVPNFDVNDTVHPGLCSLSKTSGTSTSALTLSGANFGSTQSTSTVSFSSTAAGSYTAWSDSSAKVTVPSATAGSYDVGITVGGEASNTIAFTISETTSETATITGISPSEGGIGQYVTLTGSNFGTAVGTVTFTGSTGDTATGSVDFPAACSSDYWDDNEVVIIVPDVFDNGTALSAGAYTVSVTPRGGTASSAVNFTVTEAAPTPGICSITSTADVGGSVTIVGDSFGLATDTVTFYNAVTSITATSWNNSSIEVAVPTGAVTGPVTVTVGGVESNSANLTVGAVVSTTTTAITAAYAWDFSTGEIMDVPAVVSECSADTVSAVPSNTYSEQAEICVNAVVYAEFTTLMNEVTVENALSVVKCTAAVSSPSDDPCAITEAVSGTATAASSTSASRVTWIPNVEFDTDTTYRVTVSTAALSIDSIAMARNATWEFTTSLSTEHCVVDRVTVTPSEDTISEKYANANFAANAGTGCVVVDSSAYKWNWSKGSGSYVDFDTNIDDEVDADCTADPTACASFEAFAEGVTTITATALNTSGAGNVSDDASLTVNFTDPYISNYAPDCTEACTNAGVTASFNTAMTRSQIEGGGNIVLDHCSNELCTNLAFVDSDPDCTFDPADATRCTGFAFPEEPLAAGEYYRVIVSGAVTSTSGVALIRTNYGSAYSWTFRVREDGTACAVERISLLPSSAVVAAVGDATAFTVDAFGAADSCSTSGQQLVGSKYTWGWTNPIPDADQNTVTENHTAAWKIDGVLLDGGSLSIVAGCSASCTPIGSSPDQAVCGDGVLDKGTDGSGEECDDTNTSNGDGCSETCLLEGSPSCSFTCSSTGATCTVNSECQETCDTSTSLCSVSGTVCTTNSDCAYVAATCGTTGTNCCGNSRVDVKAWTDTSEDYAESCDDGNVVNGDGCSALCLAEGSATVGSTCGNNDIAFDDTSHAGEVCDDGNNASGDGCSRLCLPEGSQSLAHLGGALCGDGFITSPYETCDDGNTNDNDGCSSVCIREGLAKCTATVTANCCGNATIDQKAADATNENSGGEDCDPAAGAEGCTSSCTFEGSSVEYATPSVCGDGVAGIGEYESCESASFTGDGKDDPTQVAYMTSGAVLEVSPTTNRAIADVTVSIAEAPDLSDTASFALTCAASSDQDCADPITTGVGIANCCVPRPILESSAPSGTSVCRNAAINGVFSEEMEKGSFTFEESADGTATTTPYMYVKLNLSGSQTCPDGYTTLAMSRTSLFARIMQTIRTFFVGEDAEAAAAAGAANSGDCILRIDSYAQTDMGDGTFKGSLNYSQALEASSSYTLVFVGDDDRTDATTEGITSKLGAGMAGTQSVTFTTGTDICTLDAVVVEDTDQTSPNTFTTTGESHMFTATPVSYSNSTRQEITSIPGVYSWTWSGWESADTTLFTAAQGDASALDTATVSAVGDNGDSTVIATATVTDSATSAQACSVSTTQSCSVDADCPGTETCETVTSTVSGSADVTALLCENPWPSLSSYPWTDDASGDSGVSELPGGYMNFSVAYCKDYGSDSGSCSVTTTTSCNADSDCPASETCSLHDFSDDLPDVNVVLAPTSPSSKVLKEYLFEIDAASSSASANDAGDVIGVRVLSNADFLSPMAWYESQGFSGSPSGTTVDGFQAVTDERSTYIAMANATAGGLYSNILVISYNEGASMVTQEVYNQMLENIHFLTNVTDTAVCSVTATTACTSDAQCPSGETCLDDKAKIMRDTARLGDLKDISIAVAAYGSDNGTCSVTTAQTCSDDTDCPSGETCEETVPTLPSGTAVRALASSAWASWSESLGGALDASSLPTDPLNAYATCSGYDSATCVNQTSGAYSCPDGSYVYHYRAVGSRDYELATELEYTASTWVNHIDDDATDAVTYYTSSYCDGDVYGTSSSCGDGIIGVNADGVTETCEIGDVQAATCTTADGASGIANAECNGTCTGYDVVAADATCSADSCGDGVVNGTEICDDGAMNGEYGYCGDLCDYVTATFCGDGVISGGEACDCGDSNATTALTDSKPYSGSVGSCIGRNGTYGANPNTTCAWDCSGAASSCGDGVLDSGEECDGSNVRWEAKLCNNLAPIVGGRQYTACTTSDDCGGLAYGLETCGGGGYDICGGDGYSPICIAGDAEKIGDLCVDDSNCGTGGICSAVDYPVSRLQTCSDSGTSGDTCTLSLPEVQCSSGSTCGDGVVNTNEECDDGNDSSTDDCTTTCTLNVCGDGYIYDSVEECDQGTENGAACDSAYESTCTACSTSCYYTTSSGEFCGDGVVNGGEFCDGADVQYTWYNGYDSAHADSSYTTNGSCDTLEDTWFDTVSGITYTCRQVGMCNGGSQNGNYCTTGSGLAIDDDTTSCGYGLGYDCVMPVCDASCASTCPTSTSNIDLLLTGNQAGAGGANDVDLYSYDSSSTSSLPNAATIMVPACTVAGNLVADVDFSNANPPDVYVVFVTDTSGSMRTTTAGTCAASGASCTSSPSCGGSDTCVGTSTRMAVAIASLKEAVATLFDELGDKVHIGLVSFSTDSTVGTKDESENLIFLGEDDETTLTGSDGVGGYVADGDTWTKEGLEDAMALFAANPDSYSANTDRIVVLMSDGQPSVGHEPDGGVMTVLEDGTELYSLGVTTTGTLLTDMDRWSSNTICEGTESSIYSCDVDEISTETTYDSSEDYNDSNLLDYSYGGSTSSELSGAYTSIIASITKGQAVLLSSSGGVISVDRGEVDDSHNIVLPWPSGFACDGTNEAEVPIQITFRGDGTINVSNVRVDYCAP